MENLALTKQEIMALYKDKGYNTKQVASILGISRRGLYDLLDNKVPQDKRERYIKLIKRLKPLYNTAFMEEEAK